MQVKDWVFDIETYGNVFTFSIMRADYKFQNTFEVSPRKNEMHRVFACLDYLNSNDQRMVGFNNLGFDYPIMHELLNKRDKLPKSGEAIAKLIYKLAQKQIDSFRGDGFGNTIREDDWYVQQLDLYKIHHFDNKARSTSLKMLEFNMKSDNIEDLPFEIGKFLTDDEIDTLIHYNAHDVKMTCDFYHKSIDMIKFREELCVKYDRNFMNHNDTKIGKDYFIMELEKSMPNSCYKIVNGKRTINQSKRPFINIKDCLFDYYDFTRPEFIAVHNWFKAQRITETKGVFSDIPEHNLGEVAKYAEMVTKRQKFKGEPTKSEIDEFKREYPMGWIEEVELKSKKNAKSYWKNWNVAETLNVVIEGFRLDFGTGGIHGSLVSKIARENSKYLLIDCDVSSMYPNIAISNKVYPEHLSSKFCEIYEDVYNQRKSHAKGTAENAMLKLALNGVYGDSNNQFSPFYDPKYTMAITINGQLSLCQLMDRLLDIPELKIIQANTDGLTVALPRVSRDAYDEVCKEWQQRVKLELEFAEYSAMYIRDVNNYIAVYTNGKIKRKGAYQYDGLGFHQNQGGLVIPMASEAQMLYGISIEDFIKNHTNKYDFLLRTKVPRSSKLLLLMDDGTEVVQQNICRYYIANDGGEMVKVMPPLAGKEEDRRMAIDKGWKIKTCNNINDYDGDVNFDYYIEEAKKLIIEV